MKIDLLIKWESQLTYTKETRVIEKLIQWERLISTTRIVGTKVWRTLEHKILQFSIPGTSCPMLGIRWAQQISQASSSTPRTSRSQERSSLQVRAAYTWPTLLLTLQNTHSVTSRTCSLLASVQMLPSKSSELTDRTLSSEDFLLTLTEWEFKSQCQPRRWTPWSSTSTSTIQVATTTQFKMCTWSQSQMLTLSTLNGSMNRLIRR